MLLPLLVLSYALPLFKNPTKKKKRKENNLGTRARPRPLRRVTGD
jgi:hypothetical protein